MTADRRDFLVAAAAGALAAVGGGVRAATLPLPEYDRLDATALAGEIRAGRITALEALEAAIARAEARSALNAIAERNFDRARAVAREISGLGRAVREQRAKSARLLGVPFALKDLGIAMKGTVTTNGCAFFRDAVAEVDSTLVQRHRAAGLNIFAKTTSPEFGQTATTESKLFGLTRNPWNLEHSTGGSSGGAAAVVAAGILPIAHATDGGGSIRIPASACGVFGLKTSRGRVPAGPAVIESSLGLSVHHAVSRSVRDSALLLQLTQGPEAGSRVGPPASTAPARPQIAPDRAIVRRITRRRSTPPYSANSGLAPVIRSSYPVDVRRNHHHATTGSTRVPAPVMKASRADSASSGVKGRSSTFKPACRATSSSDSRVTPRSMLALVSRVRRTPSARLTSCSLRLTSSETRRPVA